MEQTHRIICFENKPERCSVCDREDTVEVHHANGDKTDNRLENLVPVCRSCHQKIHSDKIHSEQISHLQQRLNDGSDGAVDFSTTDYDGVPPRASVTVKETFPGLYYYYWQWRDGDSIKCKYIAPAQQEKSSTTSSKVGSQTSIAEWCSD